MRTPPPQEAIELVITDHVARARKEVGTFEAMRMQVGSIAGVIELLSHTLESYDSGHTDAINWRAVLGALKVAQRDVAKVYSASSQLADMDGLIDVLKREAAECAK